MAQYIDKDAVLAEIERLVNNYDKALDYEAALEDVRNILDSLEVKDIQEFPISYKQSPVVLYGLTGSIGNTKEEPVSELQVKESAEIRHEDKSCKENGNSLTQEPVSEDLGDYINELSKQFPDVSFAKLSRIAVRVAKWQKEKEYTCYEEAFEDRAKWKVENLWKPADGDDLPILDREVIALLDNGKVVFAHRPPGYWDGKDIVTGKATRHYPKTYDKGGWNIPNIVYWLDVELPKEIEHE